MPSSIFNSKTLERFVPARDWLTMGVSACVLTAALTIGWEFYWRSKGYAPSLNDNKDLWAITREKVDQDPKRTVIIGSSRIFFGFNLKTWERAFGELPIQLSTVATNPNFYLDNLANETDFSGTLLVGVEQGIFFAPEGTPVELPTQNINYYKNFSPAQRWSHYVGVPLDMNFAFLEQDDLMLKHLVNHITLENRMDAIIPPLVPPYFHYTDENRQARMIMKTETDPAFAEYIKKIWITYFTPPPPPAGVTLEQHLAWFEGHMKKTLEGARKNIQKIRERGGKVIFIRYPSTGHVKELEERYTPRHLFWDRIVKDAAPDESIHFEDFEVLKGFDCPEESHLSAKDAVKFTQGLIEVLKAKNYSR